MLTYRRDQLLERQSYLQFEFPPQVDLRKYKLAFFENPIIRESKRANYVKYNPLARSSSLFSYTGADAREFSLTFNITLDNILQMGAVSKMSKEYQASLGAHGHEGTEAQKGLFFGHMVGQFTPKGNADSFISRYNSEILLHNLGYLQDDELTANEIDRRIYGGISYSNVTTPSKREEAYGKSNLRLLRNRQINTQFKRGIDLVVFFINLIRSSTLNNSVIPSYGPPIVRLYHGILFQGLPCICTNYTIGYEDRVGYDVNTLLPRQINISMTLLENRAGNYKQYDTTKINGIEGDNVAGWESLIEEGKAGTFDSRPLIGGNPLNAG